MIRPDHAPRIQSTMSPGTALGLLLVAFVLGVAFVVALVFGR